MSKTDQHGIFVGIDGSAASDAALAWACAEARLRASAVVALHIISMPYQLPRIPIEEPEGEFELKGQQVLDEALSRASTEGVVVESRLLEGAPGELLVEASEDAELIVVGDAPSRSPCIVRAGLGEQHRRAPRALPGGSRAGVSGGL